MRRGANRTRRKGHARSPCDALPGGVRGGGSISALVAELLIRSAGHHDMSHHIHTAMMSAHY